MYRDLVNVTAFPGRLRCPLARGVIAVTDLVSNFIVAAAALAAAAPTIFAFKYPKQYFRFYYLFIWVLAVTSLSLAICDGSIERAYEVTIPPQGFSTHDIQTINEHAFSSTVPPYAYLFLKGLAIYMTLLTTLPLWLARPDKLRH